MSSSSHRMLRTAAFALALVACASDRVTGPGLSPMRPTGPNLSVGPAGPVIRISEFHYDNAGTDQGERIELSGPAGVSIAGWQLVKYNGATPAAGVVYPTTAGASNITGVFPSQCSGRGTLVIAFGTDGIQNGGNDGFALVNANGVVVEFLSYEGVVTASNGPAAGRTSVDVGVSQTTTTPVGGSIERTATGTWIGRAVNSFGTCNDDDGNVTVDPDFGPLASVTVTPTSANIVVGTSHTFTARGFDADGRQVTTAAFTWASRNPELVTVNATTGVVTGDVIGDTRVIATSGGFTADAVVHVVAPPPPPADLPATRFTEIHYDNSGTDANEAIEVEGVSGASLSGWSIALYTGSTGTVYRTVDLTGVFAGSCNGRGAISFPIAGIQNGGFDTPEPDGFALVHGTELVQFLSYEGQVTATDGPAIGVTSIDIGVEEGSTSATQSLQLNTAGAWERLASSFGQVNACATASGSASISISANGPDTLVVGWQRRGFITYRDANGTTVSPIPPFTWSSDTPDIASVDARGYVTALRAGTAVIRATIGTTTNSYAIAVIDYEPLTAQYRSHVEFGLPTGADAANSVLLTKPAFVTSYNPSRGGPNWVSWNINATTFGAAERCECFSADAALPEAQRIVDFDYVSGGYDRGHMVQSESRTSTHSENAASFLLTNILPQAANNNQGPWLGFENFLNDRARIDGRQVYVVAGGEYAASPTTLKNEGRVAIPDYTWKVAIVMNTGAGLADVRGPSDITVYAVRIPNLLATAPPKNNVYQPFITTVDDIEARTGYDFFTALPDYVETIVESGDHRPTARVTGATSGSEGVTLTFDGSGSADQDVGTSLDDVLSYQWSVNGQVRGIGSELTATFADDGQYAVELIVSDRFGWADTATTTVAIANVAPAVGSFAGATIIRGEAYGAAGTFTDPGADVWTATVDYGDGSGAQALALAGTTFTLAHTYATAGAFTVTVTVRDDELGTSLRTATVVVASAEEAIGTLSGNVAALATAGTLTRGESSALDASLQNALKSLDADNPTPARNQLAAFVNKVEAMRQSGRLDSATAGALIAYAQRIIASL